MRDDRVDSSERQLPLGRLLLLLLLLPVIIIVLHLHRFDLT